MVTRSSTAVPGTSKPAARKRPSAPPSHPLTPGDAAAASFAALTVKLDYLDAADIRRVRDAYRFADEAHLGQFRASRRAVHHASDRRRGPVRRVEARRAGDHGGADARRDGGLRHQQGRADRALRRADRRPRRRPHQARQAALLDARGVAGRVVPQDAAGDDAGRPRHPRQARRPAPQHADDGRGRARQADADRRRDARDLRADRAPARPQPDLPRAAGALVQAPEAVARGGAVEGGAEGARLPARHRRPDPEGRREGVRAGQAEGADLRPREDALFDLHEDAREAPVVRAGQRHLRLSHRRRHAARVLHGARRPAPADEAGARAIQGLHRDPEGERLPVAAHDAGQPARHRGRVPDPHRADARRRREGHRRALALQGARRRPGARLGGAAPGRALAAVADRHPGRDARRRRVPRARQDRPLPRRGLRLHAEVEDPRPAARRDAGRLRLRDPHRRRRSLRRRQRQRRAGAVARRAEERRRRRDHRRAERAPEPGLAQLRRAPAAPAPRSGTT